MTQTSLRIPLAEKLRPEAMDTVVGQAHIVGSDGAVTRMLDAGAVSSLILWGPPGCGKTTIARLVAARSNYHALQLSAVTSGTAELKSLFKEAEERRAQGINTLMIIDEIHRFNRTQQDVFLPVLEDGTISLIGATTENPSFALNSALLSRCKVLVLHRLDKESLEQIVTRAEELTGKTLPLTLEAREALYAMADGDGRYLLSMCEELFTAQPASPLETSQLVTLLQKRMPLYDKSQDSHYNLISALHKSLRGSDVDAALYWLARMLDGGEEPLYILRRLVRFASEDIGLADPTALLQALAAKESYEFLGSPEGDLAIAQAVIYLATAPKSNSAYVAYKAALREAKASGSHNPPKHILNAPTKLMKEQEYGKYYIYDHDTKEGFSGQNYFPESMGRKKYYHPVERGFEREIQKRLEYWHKLRSRAE
jgi:putative ATPase